MISLLSFPYEHVHSERPNRRAVSYARTASMEGADSKIDAQHQRNQAKALEFGYLIPPASCYSDQGVSAIASNRNGLNQLIEDAESGRFSAIFVADLGRLSRNNLTTMSILNKFSRNGTRVFVID